MTTPDLATALREGPVVKRRLTADQKWARRILEPSFLIRMASELVPDNNPSSRHNHWQAYGAILATAGMILRKELER